MPQREKGNWKPYNVNFIVSNVKSVFKNHDINKLSQGAYKFISLHMGFIAHFSLQGFRSSYADLEEFAKKLQTSEYSNDYDYNLKWAVEQSRYLDRKSDYGPAYISSIGETIRGIVAVAQKYYPGRGTIRMFDPFDYPGRSAQMPAPKKASRKKPVARKRSGVPTLGGTR